MVSDQSAMSRFAQELKNARIDAGLRQVDLAERAGVSRSVVQAIEGGSSTTWSNMVAVLRALGLWDRIEATVRREGVSPIAEIDGASTQTRQRVRPESLRDSGWVWGDEK